MIEFIDEPLWELLLRLLNSDSARPLAGPLSHVAVIEERTRQIIPGVYWILLIPFALGIVFAVWFVCRKIITSRQNESFMNEMKARAASHEKAREYVSAAIIHMEVFEDMPTAAALYEKGGDLIKAAGLFEILKDRRKAIELYERAGEFLAAADLSEVVGLYEKAARLYQKCPGRAIDVARNFETADKMLAAALAYREAGEYLKASQLLEGLGMLREAAEMRGITLRQNPMALHNLEEYYKYALLLDKAGEQERAEEVFGQICRLEPAFMDVSQKLSGYPLDFKTSMGDGEIETWGEKDVSAGRSLAEVMSFITFEPREALKLWVAVLRGLKDYDKANGPHGHLSPECIIITDSQDVQIKNFFKKSRYNETIPEGAVAVTESADIYSMGMMLYEMLTGSLDGFFLAKTPAGVNPQIPAFIDELVQRCLKPAEEGRFQRIEEIFTALKAASMKKEE